MSDTAKALGHVLRENRYRIAFTYLLMVVEFSVFALLPWLLGQAVDSLISGDGGAFWGYSTASLLAVVLGFARRRFDTRVFRRVWVGKSLESIKDMESRGVKRPLLLNRVGMVGTYGDFFEHTVPGVVSSAIELVVSFAMIVAVERRLGLVTGVMAAVAILVIWFFSHRIQRNERETQALREATDQKIVHGELESIERDYELLRQKYVERSDLDAACWRTVHLLCVVADLVSIVVLVRTGQSVGTIMATLLYVSKLMDKAGQFYNFVNHLKQIEVVNQVLKKD